MKKKTRKRKKNDTTAVNKRTKENSILLQCQVLTIKMNNVMCSLCRSRDHKIRDCDQAVCHHCNKKGHLKRDCRQYRTVEKIRLHFPHDMTVHAGVNKAPLRRIPNLGTILRKLPDLEDTVEGTNQFWAEGNRLNIDYGNRDEILVSLMNGVDQAETKIHVSPARIKIASKYSIMNHELYEDGTREASGSLDDADVTGPIQIAVVARELFDSTVCLQANGSKYYLEWLSNRDVVVQSSHLYKLRMGPPPRRPIANLAEYFVGPHTPPQIVEAAATPMVSEITVKSDEENVDEVKGAQRVEYIITVENEASTSNDHQQTDDTVQPNSLDQPLTVAEADNNSSEGSDLSSDTVTLFNQQFELPTNQNQSNVDQESHASDCVIIDE